MTLQTKLAAALGTGVPRMETQEQDGRMYLVIREPDGTTNRMFCCQDCGGHRSIPAIFTDHGFDKLGSESRSSASKEE